MQFVVSTTRGSFYVEAIDEDDARAFTIARLASRYPGEIVKVLAVMPRAA